MLSADAVGMSSSIVSSLQLPDRSESGLFDSLLKPRERSYQDDWTTMRRNGEDGQRGKHDRIII